MSTQQQIKEIYGKIRLRLAPEHSAIVARVAELVNLGREDEALRLVVSLSMAIEYGHMLYRDSQYLPDYNWLDRTDPEVVRLAALQLHAQIMRYRLQQPQQRELLQQAVDLLSRGPAWSKRSWMLLYDLHTSIVQELPAPKPLPDLDALPEAKARSATESRQGTMETARSVGGLTALVDTIQDSAFKYWVAGSIHRKLSR